MTFGLNNVCVCVGRVCALLAVYVNCEDIDARSRCLSTGLANHRYCHSVVVLVEKGKISSLFTECIHMCTN